MKTSIVQAVSIVAVSLVCIPLTQAGPLDWLMFHHELEVIVNTDVTPEGATIPPASLEHPVFYLGTSVGYRDFGGIIAGDKTPSDKIMHYWLAKALAKQGYFPANAEHSPTQIVAVAWGSLYPQYSWYPELSLQTNQRQLLRFIGGEKMGLLSKNSVTPYEAEPELTPLRPDADKYLGAASDDLYVAVLMGFDFHAAQNKRAHILWRTQIACPSRGFVMADTLPKMISIAAPLIAHQTETPAWVRASDRYKPSIKIGDLVVREYLSPIPMPASDADMPQSGKDQ